MITMRRYAAGLSGALLHLSLLYGSLTAASGQNQVKTESGIVEGSLSPESGIRAFKGIPFAAPPTGKLRWQAPQPVLAWKGVRRANSFGSRCMQGAIFSDMIFRDGGPSEDCLYLNVWSPAKEVQSPLPVMVWIYGGGFQAGAASEPRQDGENLAKKGVVVVSLNYRLGVFGFFAHPDLAKESPQHAAGNYGLMDQTAALQWVKKNISAFGGDPSNVTIFGESAGSMSVSAQMASPLARDLFQKAIGESGAFFPLRPSTLSMEESEQVGLRFGQSISAASLDELRAKPAAELMKAALATKDYRFWPNVDGYFLPENPTAIYASGRQAHVPLLAGWNADEQSAKAFFGKTDMNAANYVAKVHEVFGNRADDVLKQYPEGSFEESARDLAGDQFIAYSTWKWIDTQAENAGVPVFRYHFEQAPPSMPGKPSRGAFHSGDIQYVFDTLSSEKLAWTDNDRMCADEMSSYWSNFAKKGDPNGDGLPKWPAYSKSSDYQTMHLQCSGGQKLSARPDELRARYEILDGIATQAASGKNGSAAPSGRD